MEDLLAPGEEGTFNNDPGACDGVGEAEEEEKLLGAWVVR